MESKYSYAFETQKSVERINAILNENNDNFEELNTIPDRSKLTYTNGFYVNVGAVFADIRKSSELTGEHKRPRLAKLYRCYISETVAILNSWKDCKEVNITGDCVSGIFDAEKQNQIENMVHASAMIHSLVKILNNKLSKNGIVNVTVGIGVAYGRALMIKSGYSGSGINEVVWMGDVVNEASNLCNKANQYNTKAVLIDLDVYNKINDDLKKLFSRSNYYNSFYEGDIINNPMNNWYKDHCK